MPKRKSPDHPSNVIDILILNEQRALHKLGEKSKLLVNLLLDRGDDPNAADNYKRLTPVHLSAMGEEDLDLRLPNFSSLHDVVKDCPMASRPMVLETLLQKGGNPNADNWRYDTPVHMAITNYLVTGPEILKILLKYGGNPNGRLNYKNETPPVLMAFNNYWNEEYEIDELFEILKILLKYGGNPNAVNYEKDTLLHLAIRECCGTEHEILKRPEILKILLKYGGNPNAENKQKDTPLHLVSKWAWSPEPEIMKILLKYGGNPNAKNTRNDTPVHKAIKNYSDDNSGPEILKILLENGGNPNAENVENDTPVHMAIKYFVDIDDIDGPEIRRVEFMKILLEYGGNPNAVNNKKETPLHLAANISETSGPRIMKMLLEKGGNPNALCYKNKTPVHIAAENDSDYGPIMKKMLLKKGGNLNSKRKSKRSRNDRQK